MNRSLLVLSLAVVPASLVFGTGCKKEVPPVPEAGVVVDASAAVDPDAGAAVADTLDAAVAPLVTAVHTAAVVTGGPFQGSYKCFNGMTVTQVGSTVSARLFPGDGKNYSVLACTVAGNDCEGKVTGYKDGKQGEIRTASLKRNDKGDLTYRGQNEPQPTLCRKQ